MDHLLINAHHMHILNYSNTSSQNPATSDFFILQLEILTNLANEANISTVLREFQVG